MKNKQRMITAKILLLLIINAFLWKNTFSFSIIQERNFGLMKWRRGKIPNRSHLPLFSSLEKFMKVHERIFDVSNESPQDQIEENNEQLLWKRIDSKPLWLSEVKEIELYGDFLANLSKTKSIESHHIKHLYSHYHQLLRFEKQYEPLLFLQIMILLKVQVQVLSLLDQSNIEVMSHWDLYFTDNQRLRQQFQELVVVYLFRLSSAEESIPLQEKYPVNALNAHPFYSHNASYRSYLQYLYDFLWLVGKTDFENVWENKSEVSWSYEQFKSIRSRNQLFARMMSLLGSIISFSEHPLPLQQLLVDYAEAITFLPGETLLVDKLFYYHLLNFRNPQYSHYPPAFQKLYSLLFPGKWIFSKLYSPSDRFKEMTNTASSSSSSSSGITTTTTSTASSLLFERILRGYEACGFQLRSLSLTPSEWSRLAFLFQQEILKKKKNNNNTSVDAQLQLFKTLFSFRLLEIPYRAIVEPFIRCFFQTFPFPAIHKGEDRRKNRFLSMTRVQQRQFLRLFAEIMTSAYFRTDSSLRSFLAGPKKEASGRIYSSDTSSLAWRKKEDMERLSWNRPVFLSVFFTFLKEQVESLTGSEIRDSSIILDALKLRWHIVPLPFQRMKLTRLLQLEEEEEVKEQSSTSELTTIEMEKDRCFQQQKALMETISITYDLLPFLSRKQREDILARSFEVLKNLTTANERRGEETYFSLYDLFLMGKFLLLRHHLQTESWKSKATVTTPATTTTTTRAANNKNTSSANSTIQRASFGGDRKEGEGAMVSIEKEFFRLYFSLLVNYMQQWKNEVLSSTNTTSSTTLLAEETEEEGNEEDEEEEEEDEERYLLRPDQSPFSTTSTSSSSSSSSSTANSSELKIERVKRGMTMLMADCRARRRNYFQFLTTFDTLLLLSAALPAHNNNDKERSLFLPQWLFEGLEIFQQSSPSGEALPISVISRLKTSTSLSAAVSAVRQILNYYRLWTSFFQFFGDQLSRSVEERGVKKDSSMINFHQLSPNRQQILWEVFQPQQPWTNRISLSYQALSLAEQFSALERFLRYLDLSNRELTSSEKSIVLWKDFPRSFQQYCLSLLSAELTPLLARIKESHQQQHRKCYQPKTRRVSVAAKKPVTQPEKEVFLRLQQLFVLLRYSFDFPWQGSTAVPIISEEDQRKQIMMGSVVEQQEQQQKEAEKEEEEKTRVISHEELMQKLLTSIQEYSQLQKQE